MKVAARGAFRTGTAVSGGKTASSSRRQSSKRPTSAQASQLLPEVLRALESEEPVCVLNVGPAMAETIAFFSAFRCKLYVVDLLRELPLPGSVNAHETEEEPIDLIAQFRDTLGLPPDTRLDICLFWECFNYLDRVYLEALQQALRPALHSGTLGHAFSVHNTRSATTTQRYAIRAADTIATREVEPARDSYKPHPQQRLQTLLHDFAIKRSVLLPDNRLELLLQVRGQD